MSSPVPSQKRQWGKLAEAPAFPLFSQNRPGWKSGCLVSLEAIWLSYPSPCPESDCPLLLTLLLPSDGAPVWEGEAPECREQDLPWASSGHHRGSLSSKLCVASHGAGLAGLGQSGSDQVLTPSLGLLFMPLWQFGNSNSTDWLVRAINAHSLCIHGYL